MKPHDLDELISPPGHTDGHSMWASVQKEPPPREPDYRSIEQLFCVPVIEPKDKVAAAPVKKEPKEVHFVISLRRSELTQLIKNAEQSMHTSCTTFFLSFFILCR